MQRYLSKSGPTFRSRAIWFLCASLLSAAAGAEPPKPASIAVPISGLKNTTGEVECLLFRSSGGFPEESAKAFRRMRVAISPTRSARCAFTDIPAGTYAVSTMHDENRNGEMDYGFFGPKEGYGPSNNITHTFSAPKWDESKFNVPAGTTVTTAIKMKY